MYMPQRQESHWQGLKSQAMGDSQNITASLIPGGRISCCLPGYPADLPPWSPPVALIHGLHPSLGPGEGEGRQM